VKRLLAALLVATGAAQADPYRLQPGDVLELVVVAPPLREHAPVDIDGNITLPIAGTLAAEGRSLADLTAEARERLAAAPLPPMAAGETLPARIWPAAVSLHLRHYRPVYVGGDVRAGGAFPFTPGLTARRAVLLAGRPPDGEIRRLELEGALAQLGTRRTAAAHRLERLRRELDPDPHGAPPLPPTERAILAERRQQDHAAAAYFDRAIGHTRAQIADLTAQLANETEGMAGDREDFARIEDLRAAGTATALRLTDARRALLFSTTRQLQTATELARTTRELGSVEYEELRRTLDLRLEAVSGVAAATQLVAELDAQIAAARRQLAWLGTPEAAEDIAITASDGTVITLGPAEDHPLRPGDLVTVSREAIPPTD
jgi:polysaccharide export outer membrane protein